MVVSGLGGPWQKSEMQEGHHLCRYSLVSIKARWLSGMLNTYLANANIIRLLVVMTLRRAKIKQTRGSLVNSVSQLSKYQHISRCCLH